MTTATKTPTTIKAIVDKSSLMQAVRVVRKACDGAGLLPILANVLITAEPGRLTIQAGDVRLYLSTGVSADVQQPGQACVPGKTLFGLLRLLGHGDLSLSLDDGYLVIDHGSDRYRLPSLDPADWPPTPQAKSRVALLTGGILAQAVAMIGPFAEKVRPNILRAINLSATDGAVTFAATDGYRMAIKSSLLATAVQDFNLNVPAKELDKACALFDGDEAVAVFSSADNTHLLLKGETKQAVIRLEIGKFPDYTMVIPSAFERRLTANRETLRAAVARCALFSSRVCDGLAVTLEADRIVIKGDNYEGGDSKVTVPAELDGEPLEIQFSAHRLAGALTSLRGRQVEINLGGPTSQAIFQAPGDPTHKILVMPIRP